MNEELDSKIAIQVMGSVVLGFRPSSSEADAGRVIDKLAEHGLMITVYTGIYRARGVKCRCCIMRGAHDLDFGGISAVADTRPLAICEAALEAKMRGWIDESSD